MAHNVHNAQRNVKIFIRWAYNFWDKTELRYNSLSKFSAIICMLLKFYKNKPFSSCIQLLLVQFIQTMYICASKFFFRDQYKSCQTLILIYIYAKYSLCIITIIMYLCTIKKYVNSILLATWYIRDLCHLLYPYVDTISQIDHVIHELQYLPGITGCR